MAQVGVQRPKTRRTSENLRKPPNCSSFVRLRYLYTYLVGGRPRRVCAVSAPPLALLSILTFHGGKCEGGPVPPHMSPHCRWHRRRRVLSKAKSESCGIYLSCDLEVTCTAVAVAHVGSALS